ncbi:MAG: hypothetical protein AB8B99_16635 [Phormidesmis sp.]
MTLKIRRTPLTATVAVSSVVLLATAASASEVRSLHIADAPLVPLKDSQTTDRLAFLDSRMLSDGALRGVAAEAVATESASASSATLTSNVEAAVTLAVAEPAQVPTLLSYAYPVETTAVIPVAALASSAADNRSLSVALVPVAPASSDVLPSVINASPTSTTSIEVSAPVLLSDASVLGSIELNATTQAAADLAQTVDDTFAPLTENELRQQLQIDPNTPVEALPAETLSILDRPQPVPSSSFLTPTAYGADWGDAYVGVAGATVNGPRDVDGSISAGIGFGDAVDNVGVELSTSIISLDGFADDGIVGLQVHKLFPKANNLGVAVGWANPIKWGAANDAEDTFYGVVTRRFDMRPNKANPLPLVASLGIGTGTFRSTGAIAADDNAPNVFGSLGLRVIPEVSLVSSWTGSALGLGVSAAPFKMPIIFNAGLADVTDNTADGLQFSGSVGYSFSF